MSYLALVTGASSGIGEATARRLAREPDVRLVLVARRAEKLESLCAELGGSPRAVSLALDLTEEGAPARVKEFVHTQDDGLHLLVNNAGGSWRGHFGDAGWANLDRHMRLNFAAPARLTEALLPGLRETAAAGKSRPGRRVGIVNVASTASRVSRPGAGAYSASKFALAGWSDALHLEERGHGVHVGLVLPGFVQTEGFPATELLSGALTRRIVSQPQDVAEAIMAAGPGGQAERYVPRYYWIAAALRLLAPALIRRATSGGGFTTVTKRQE